MPLLMCPNCQSNMQSLNRSNVEFDMCPSCRGVWLDRGELEKLMEGASAAAPAQVALQQAPRPTRSYADNYGEAGESGERGYDHHGKRKRRIDIFDIFD